MSEELKGNKWSDMFPDIRERIRTASHRKIRTLPQLAQSLRELKLSNGSAVIYTYKRLSEFQKDKRVIKDYERCLDFVEGLCILGGFRYMREILKFLAVVGIRHIKKEDEVRIFNAIQTAYPQATPTVLSQQTISRRFKLIGRDKEMVALREAWQRAQSGNSQFALIEGSKGIGKRRLAEELLFEVASQAVTASAKCYYYSSKSAFAPLRKWLHTKSVDDVVQGMYDPAVDSAVRRLDSGEDPQEFISDEVSFWDNLAKPFVECPKPVVLLLEDLHQCDVSTVNWLNYLLLERDPNAKLLVMATFRYGMEKIHVDAYEVIADLITELSNGDKLREINLEALSEADAIRLAKHVSRRTSFNEDELKVVQRLNGNPSKIVAFANKGFRDKLPVGLKLGIDLLLSKLSMPAIGLLEVLAVAGKGLDAQVLTRASGLSKSTFDDAVRELYKYWPPEEVKSTVIDVNDGDVRFLVRENIPAYKEKSLHIQIADAVQHEHGTRLNLDTSLQIAEHYDRGGKSEAAIPFYEEAAKHARAVFVYLDSIKYLRRALEILAMQPDGPDREGQEINLQLSLATNYAVIQGYTSKATVESYHKVEQLTSYQTDPSPQRAEALFGLAAGDLTRGSHEQAIEHAHQCLAVSRALGDIFLQSEAITVLGYAHLHLGRPLEASEFLKRAHTIYEGSSYPVPKFPYIQDPRVAGLAWLGLAQWFLGYPDQGLETASQALRLAQEISHRFSEAMALVALSWIYLLRKDWEKCKETANELIKISEKHNFVLWLPVGKLFYNRAVGQSNLSNKIIKNYELACKEYIGIGAEISVPAIFLWLAELYQKNGNVQTALKELDNAMLYSQKNNERFYDSEIFRLRGELTLIQGHNSLQETKRYFRDSLSLATSQKTRGWELRTLISLFRLKPRKGTAAKLKRIYEGFEEGHGTNDLKEAQSLLGSKI